MRKAKYLDGIFALAKRGDIVEVLTAEEAKSYPNMKDGIESIDEIVRYEDEECGGVKFVGFVKSLLFTDDDPDFIQVYPQEIEFIEE